MARKRIIFFRPLPTILKFLLHFGLHLGLSPTLLIVSFHSEVLSASIASSKELSAIRLTEKGHEQLQQFQAQEALQSWEAAYKIYHQLNNTEGITGSLINQSLALQALGLYPRACQTLIQALKLEDWICNSSIQQVTTDKEKQQLILALQKQPSLKVQVLGLKNLGNVQRLLGKTDTSEIVLKKAIEFAKILNLETNLNNDILLDLANTERTLYMRAKNKYQLTDEPLAKQKYLDLAQSKFQTTLELYQKATGILAQLNQLNLLLELKQDLDFWTPSSTVPVIKGLESQNINNQIKTLVTELQAAQFRELPVIESIYAQLNFATSLLQIARLELAAKNSLSSTENTNLLDESLSAAFDAWHLTRKIKSERAESYALGTIAKIYNDFGQLRLSEEYLEKALGLAQSVQAWDIAYQWQQQLGRLYKQLGHLDKATQTYAAAIISLERVQNSILSVNPEFQFDFKQKIEPVYQEYLELLLSREQPDFKLVIQTKEQLQLAELKNFLQCNQLPILLESQNKIQSTTHSLPIIYLFRLGKRVDVIVKTTNGSIHHHMVNLELVNGAFDNLLRILQSERFVDVKPSDFLNYSQTLYQLLIAPIKNYLPSNGTLVFEPDTYFQNFPFVLLHDGKNYLLKSYSVSMTLSSQFQQSQSFKPEHLKVLIAGISQPNPNLKDPLVSQTLSPLPEVETEIHYVEHNTTSLTELLNAKFTSERFQRVMRKNAFPIVHISTHGQFSSDPEQTFILAWDKAINVRDLNSLLRNNKNEVSLLVLSACQTAKGDKRSALGIAGATVQAGARSTLASLWLVDASSTAQLMGEFYKGLNSGLILAEALRQAQLTLLKHPKYHHPYYWSSFILLSR